MILKVGLYDLQNLFDRQTQCGVTDYSRGVAAADAVLSVTLSALQKFNSDVNKENNIPNLN